LEKIHKKNFLDDAFTQCFNVVLQFVKNDMVFQAFACCISFFNAIDISNFAF